LYTHTAKFFPDSGRRELNSRETYFNSILQVLYGISKRGKINIGFDANIRSVLIDSEKRSAFYLFAPPSQTLSRTEFTSIGPKIKFTPFAKINHLSIQSAFWIPLAKNTESSPWLAYERYTWWTQFFYDKRINTNFQLFAEIDALIRIPKFDYQPYSICMPASIFISYFPKNSISIYGMLQVSPAFAQEAIYLSGGEIAYGFIMPEYYYAQGGLGCKFQLTKTLEFELLYTNFFAGNNWAGAGETYNLGLRYLH